MKPVISILFIFVFGLFAQAQTDKIPSVKTEKIINLPLPKGTFRPKTTLKKALQIAEKYIEKEKMDSTRYYLHGANFILYGSDRNEIEKASRKPAWFFQWVNENGALGDYIDIVVIIETGDVAHLPSM